MSSHAVLHPRATEKDFVASIVYNNIVGSDIFPSSEIVDGTLAMDAKENDEPAAVKAARVSKFALKIGIFQLDELTTNEKEVEPMLIRVVQANQHQKSLI